MLDEKFIDHLKIATSAEILTNPADCWPYGYDNSRLHTTPEAVIFVNDHEQTAATVCACRDYGVPLTARGRGTGTTGASVPVRGGVVISFERMAEIIEIDVANRTLRAQPGALNGTIQAYCKPHGFFWPPNPSSANYSTLGGNLACNAAGPSAVKYGTARENTLGLKAVSGNGQTIITGTQTTKGVVGLDLTRLLIGSEGTLALITEATLKLTTLLPFKKTMRACYQSIEGAVDAVTKIMAQPTLPCTLELMDEVSLQLVQKYTDIKLDSATKTLLMIEIDSDKNTLDETIRTFKCVTHNNDLIHFEIANNEHEVNELWRARKNLSPTLRMIATGKINEDIVVPISKLAKFIQKVDQLSKHYQLTIACFGHAGNGNLHVNILYDTNEPTQEKNAHLCLSDVFDTVLELGGTLSGEHGVGLTKRDYIAREISCHTLDITRQIMQVFDPQGILNPDKGIPPVSVK